MTYRQTRKIAKGLCVGQWLIVGLTGACILRALFLTTALPQPQEPADTADSPRDALRGDVVPVAEFSRIWTRDLRQTLIDPDPRPEAPAPKRPQPKPVKLPALQATFVERGEAWGLFTDQKGQPRVRRTGTVIDSFEIVSIVRGAATLRRDARQYQVKIPRYDARVSLSPKRRATKGW